MRTSWPRWGAKKAKWLGRTLRGPGWLAAALFGLLLVALQRLLRRHQPSPPTPGPAPPPFPFVSPRAGFHGRSIQERVFLILATVLATAALIGAIAALLAALSSSDAPSPQERKAPQVHPQFRQLPSAPFGICRSILSVALAGSNEGGFLTDPQKSGSRARPTAPIGHEAKAQAPQEVSAMKPLALGGEGNCWRKKPPSMEYIGMKQRSETAVGGFGRGKHEENRWIKSGSRIDLEGMRRPGRGALDGELMTSGGRKETDRCAAQFLPRGRHE
jgi:hypothetical protein